jgi:hypothetical protein
MSESAAIHQSVQVGVQTGEGATPATRRLRTLSVTPNVAVETASIKTAGEKFGATVVKTKEWSTVSVEGTPDYRELALLLAACVGNGTETIVEGAHVQTWATRQNGSDELRPLTVERGSVGGTAVRTEDVHLAGFTLSWQRSDGTGSVSADGFGKALEVGTTLTGNQVTTVALTGTPESGTFTLDVNGAVTAAISVDATAADVAAAIEAALNVAAGTVIATGGPFPANPVTVEFNGTLAQSGVSVAVDDNDLDDGAPTVTDTTAAGTPYEYDPLPILAEHVLVEIDGTPQNRVLSVEVELTDRHAPVWYLDRDASWASTVETEPSLTVSLLVAFDAQAEAVLNQLRTSATDYLTISALGPVVGGVQNTLTIESPFAVESVEEFSDEDGVYAIGFSLRAIHADGDGPTFTLVNNGVWELWD